MQAKDKQKKERELVRATWKDSLDASGVTPRVPISRFYGEIRNPFSSVVRLPP